MPVTATKMQEGTLFFYQGIFEKPGDTVLTRRHARDSVSVLLFGEVTVENAGEVKFYTAPATIPIRAGARYLITALVPYTMTMCVHNLEPGETFPPLLK
jgi:hypothetical protein